MIWTRTRARRARELLEKAMAAAPLTDAEASEIPTLFPHWEDIPEGHEYTQEDVEKRPRVYYGGSLYVIVQPHRRQADWPPDAVSMYERVAYRGGIREIPEHITAEFPFREGEEGIDADGAVWVSLCDNNVYTPAQYAQNWRRKDNT